MVYAEYQHLSTGWNGKDFSGPRQHIKMCGGDSTFICDGRKTLQNQVSDAVKHAKMLNRTLNKGITGLIMYRGEYCKGRPITKFIAVPADTD